MVDSKAPVTIKDGDTNRVTVSYMDGDASLPKANVNKGTLTIKGGNSTRHLNVSIFSLSDRSTTNGGVLITVPRDKKLDSIVVKTGSGSLSLRQLRVKQVAIENTDDVNLYALRVDRNVTVYSTDGDIYADQVRAKQLRVNADDGDMGISNSQLMAMIISLPRPMATCGCRPVSWEVAVSIRMMVTSASKVIESRRSSRRARMMAIFTRILPGQRALGSSQGMLI